MYKQVLLSTVDCRWKHVNGKLPQRKSNLITVTFSWTVAQYIDLNRGQQISIY